jgi:glutaredoxin
VTLFTKPNCKKCDWLKQEVDLDKVEGLEIHELDGNVDALAELAWYELVSAAETTLPILVLDDGSSVTGVVKIKKILKGKSDETCKRRGQQP